VRNKSDSETGIMRNLTHFGGGHGTPAKATKSAHISHASKRMWGLRIASNGHPAELDLNREVGD